MENAQQKQGFISTLEDFIHRQPALFVFFWFSAGIALCWSFISQVTTIAVTGMFVLTLLLFLVAKRLGMLFIIPALLAAGAAHLYFSLAKFPENQLLNIKANKIAALRGWISETTYRQSAKHRYLFTCSAARIDSQWQEVDGKIYLYTAKGIPRLRYGQRLRIQSRPHLPPVASNPGAFNFRRYLNLQKIYQQLYVKGDQIQLLPEPRGNPIIRYFIQPLRNKLRSQIEKYIPPPATSVVKAMLLGERQDLDRTLVARFQKTGIVHVLAISGLHTGFILMLFMLIFGMLRFSYRQRILLSLLFLFLFIVLINFKVAALRAGLMATLYFIVKLRQQHVSALQILGLAGLLILLWQPQQSLMPGFQFSFAAVGGILYGYPNLRRSGLTHSQYPRLNKWILQPLMVSLAAVLATTPLTWYYYGTLQTAAVFINIILIPLIGGFVVLSFIFLLISLPFPGVCAGLGQILGYYFSAISGINAWFARLPFVQVQFGYPGAMTILLAGLLVLLILRVHKRAFLAAGVVLLLIGLLNLPQSKKMRLTFIDVGQGDATLIELPNGRNMLVDGGERSFGFDAAKLHVLPVLRYYGIRHINYLVCSHAHSDHFGGLQTVINQMPVDTLYVSSYKSKAKQYNRFLQSARKLGIYLKTIRRGQRITIGKNLRLYTLHPFGKFVLNTTQSGHEVNNSSLVFKLSYGKTHVMLTGDLEQDGEAYLLNYGQFINCDLLKAGHHGSRTSSSAAFLDALTPHWAVISVGRGNRYFHPSRSTIARMYAKGIRPLRTDHLGALVFESDGRELHVINWRH